MPLFSRLTTYLINIVTSLFVQSPHYTTDRTQLMVRINPAKR